MDHPLSQEDTPKRGKRLSEDKTPGDKKILPGLGISGNWYRR